VLAGDETGGLAACAWYSAADCARCFSICFWLCAQNLAKRDHAKKMQEMREWSDDELRMLDKAVKKFPMGTPKRWEQVRTLHYITLITLHCMALHCIAYKCITLHYITCYTNQERQVK
jgi:hypothetical protein